MAGACLAALAVTLALLPAPVPAAPARPVPLLAYYYIWYDKTSWRRAKDDYPALGRYSSDDPTVMARQVDLARQAGIDGFIVSWKSTPVLNRRLEQLARIAAAKGLKLALIYEGLDFHRNPLPVDQVLHDLTEAAGRYARGPAFGLFDRPLVIWSGTWRYTPAQVARVVRPLRGRLMILASERDPDGVRRLGGLVDGDAYYWSSVDPRHTPRYEQKLVAMGQAVHAQKGLWVAPAAPGFDARKLGGKRVVGRRDGATLGQEMNAAMRSSPDAVGLISWNEFSEGSYVEPSIRYGRRYLDVLASIQHAPEPGAAPGSDFASDEPSGRDTGPARLLLLGAVLLGGIAGLAVILRRAANRTERE
ncbi:MAG TPA: endo-1,3-alpha-glucanase family glycosylhydrolase [Actinomycetes bacterium]|nr:endo-1,3-alpha-glucanase family glycosylhydrolase [Actinomycetes bacterium]